MRNFKQFLHTTRDVFRIYWEIAPGLTTGVLVTQIISQLQGLAQAYIFGVFINDALRVITVTKNIKEIIPTTIIIAALFVFFDVVEILNNYFGSVLSSIDVAKIRLKQTDFMIRLGISKMENPDLTNRSTRFNEVYNSMGQHLILLVNLIAMTISTIGYAIVVLAFAPFIALLMLLVFAIKFFNNERFITKLWRLRLDSTEENRNAWTSIGYLADPASLKEVLLANGIDLLRNKFLRYIEWFSLEYKKIRTRWAIFENLQRTIDGTVFGMGVFLLIKKAIEINMSVGTVAFYLRSLGSLSDQLSGLSYRIASTVDSSIRLRDALELFELYKPEDDGEKNLETQDKPPTINIRNISFTYPNGKSAVIKDLNLTFKPGEKVAIVGENGAGKTTLVKLLTRIYRPQMGVIDLNGLNINDLKRESLYNKFGVLFQDFNSYGNLSVEENVHIGKSTRNIDKDLIEKALVKADAMSFVEKYPELLNQILSERYKGGIRPSGGQWQKIAIARLFYRNAPILILDEPTASIDAISESKIFDNVYKFMKGKTVIIISHRFSTVRNADRILVLDKGKIIEEGTHEKLMREDGKYAHAFRLQAKGYQ